MMRIYLYLVKKISRIRGLLYGKMMTSKPLSRRFGFDRGTPIDRYYIEKFLKENSNLIKGDVLEIAESTYSKKFGGNKLKRSIVMSYEAGMNVDFVANLETGEGIKENIADCFICTQTYPFVFDVKSAIKNSLKLIKPGGVLLVTVPGITQISRYDMDRWGHYWSFTDLSLRKLFEEIVPKENIEVKTYGNVKVSSAFLYGLATEEMSEHDLNVVDRDYQLTITAVIRK